jgi:hypothetical protein
MRRHGQSEERRDCQGEGQPPRRQARRNVADVPDPGLPQRERSDRERDRVADEEREEKAPVGPRDRRLGRL